MNAEIKERIEQVQRGEVPEGYHKDHGYVMPNGWTAKKFSDNFLRLNRKNGMGCEKVLTISAQMGLIDQQDYYNHSYASEDKSGYYLLTQGDFAYNKSYSDGYPFGAIKRLERYEEGVVSPLYICFEPKAYVNSDFWAQYFDGGFYNKEIYMIAQEGARNHGLLNVSVEEFLNGIIVCPPINEQEKIAEILTHCDMAINQKKQLIEEKQNQKKWLMHNLLNPDSEVRMSGFEEDWNHGHLIDVVSGLEAGTSVNSVDEAVEYSASHSFILKTSAISNGKLDITQIKKIIPDDCSRVSCPLSKDCLLISRMNTPALVGACAYSDVEFENVYLPDRLWKALPRKDNTISMKWLNYVLNQECYKVIFRKVAGGTSNSMKNISQESFLQIPLSYPSKVEQTAIANILSAADHEIDLLEQELDQWQTKKKALMQLLLTGIVRV